MDASKLTRRQLLKRFGAVGGSSLVMGAMGAWDLMGQPSGPRPVLKGTRPDTKVIVLGAGLDTFAYRQPRWAKHLAIIEVDHPASQAFKRQQLRRRPTTRAR